MRGTVRWFNSQKGFGFITDSEGKDHFVHYSSIAMDGRKHLFDGDIVDFEVGTDNNGREQAVNVQPIITLSMVLQELSKEGLHTMRMIEDKGKSGWLIVDESENPVVDKEMDLVQLAAYAGIDVEGV